MKKIIIGLGVLVLIMAGVGALWLFRATDRASLPAYEGGAGKFFSASEVKDSDVVVRINAQGGFEPKELTVKKGTRVVFVNESDAFQWPASDIHPTHGIYPEFDPKEPIAAGEAWAFTFEKVGRWNMHNHLKPSQVGVITVAP